MSGGIDGSWLVVRFDDVLGLCPRLSQAWEAMEKNGVPLHLEVVPEWLDGTAASALAGRARRSRVPIAVHQHGTAHVNHGTQTRRFEFDDCRGVDAQLADIRQGRAVLEASLCDWFELMFSPPWNRYGASTLQALARADFTAFSCLAKPDATTHPSIAFVPMTLDPVRWRPHPRYLPWNQIQSELIASLEQDGFAGLELHHDVMTQEDVDGLDRLLEKLRALGVRFPTMQTVAEGKVPR
ncbi:MAG: DUF2334 domain-containing protein [Phycisphaerae bacterium]